MAWPRQQFGYMPDRLTAPSRSLPRATKTLKIADLISPVDAQDARSRVTQTVPTEAEHLTFPHQQSRLLYSIPIPTFRPVRRGPEQDWDGLIARLEQPEIPATSPSEQSARPVSSKHSQASPSSQTSQPRSASASPGAPISPIYPPPPAGVVIPALPDYEYKLSLRQQPQAARACGHGDRDRRVIDPPPILELQTTSKQDGTPRLDPAGIFALYCNLVDADTGRDSGCSMQGDLDSRMMSAMMGASTQSPFKGKDEHGIAGTFFVFSDLSCRLTGRFRLDFTLLRVDATHMQPGARHPMVATISSAVFTAYNAKEFPGMQASTPLLKALRRQGLTVSIKKGSEQRKLRGRSRADYSPPLSDTGTHLSAHGKRKASTESSMAEHKRLRHNAGVMGQGSMV